jgi:biopolymer transport protein ExbB/TolQ
MYDGIVKFFQDGGEFMYPILVVLALGIAIAIERYIYLTKTSVGSQRTWNQIMPLLQAGKFREARVLAEQSNTAISSVLAYGLARLTTSRKREDIEMAMEEGLMEVVPRLEKRTHYLSTLANTAPLLGLLGTIIGLIHSFAAVANADPVEKATLLSASISVAMNATAFGLIVGIPLMLIHAVLQSKGNQIVDSLEMASVKVLNIIGDRAGKEAATP